MLRFELPIFLFIPLATKFFHSERFFPRNANLQNILLRVSFIQLYNFTFSVKMLLGEHWLAYRLFETHSPRSLEQNQMFISPLFRTVFPIPSHSSLRVPSYYLNEFIKSHIFAHIMRLLILKITSPSTTRKKKIQGRLIQEFQEAKLKSYVVSALVSRLVLWCHRTSLKYGSVIDIFLNIHVNTLYYIIHLICLR